MSEQFSPREAAFGPAASEGLPALHHGVAATPLRSVPRTNSRSLLEGGRELEILHGDAVYRLRLTAMGKLILTK